MRHAIVFRTRIGRGAITLPLALIAVRASRSSASYSREHGVRSVGTSLFENLLRRGREVVPDGLVDEQIYDLRRDDDAGIIVVVRNFVNPNINVLRGVEPLDWSIVPFCNAG